MTTAKEQLTKGFVSLRPGLMAVKIQELHEILVDLEIYYRQADDLANNAMASDGLLRITGGGYDEGLVPMFEDVKKVQMRHQLGKTVSDVEMVKLILEARMVALGKACSARVSWEARAEARATALASKRKKRGPKPKYSQNGRGS